MPIDRREISVIRFERQADVDPTPVDAGIFERLGKGIDAAPKERHRVNPARRHAREGMPEGVKRLRAPARAIVHKREAVVARHHDIIDRGIALQYFSAVVHHTAVVLVDDGAGGDIAQRHGDAVGLGTKIFDKRLLLSRQDREDKDEERDQGDQPREQRRAQGDVQRAGFGTERGRRR